ncbi:MAG: PAS domain S-box protein [Candidatus Lokiarchaeota archaeon]|nr:PAS domain S-box protein [Candidatus Lokiarchaeota archaeon]
MIEEEFVELRNMLMNRYDLLVDYIENIIDGTFIVELKNHKSIYVNEEFAKIIGISKHRLSEIDFLTLIHPQYKKTFLNYITKLDKIKVRHKNIRIKLLKNFKFPIDCEISGNLIELKKQKLVFGIVRDVSETNRLERVFEKQKINFKEILETINDAVCIINTNGKFEYISPRLPIILEGREISDNFFDLIYPDDIKKIKQKCQESLENHDLIYLDSFEFRAVKENQDTIWLEANTRKYYKNSNKPTGFLVVLRDISQRKEMEERLKKYHQELLELDKLKSEFLTNASHELRTPLVSINGFTDILLSGKSGELSSQQYEDLKIIRRNTDRIISLVDDLLDVSKIETGKLMINKRKFNIIELIKNCLTELHYQIEERNHNIITKFPDEELIVYADDHRIHQLIINLLDNAIKYTPPFGKIEISLNSEEEKVNVCVKDNGIGLTDEERQRIFKRFGKIYLLDNVDTVDSRGTGLGLVICKGIIKKHDGEIWVTSEGKNKGSEFHFTIPKQ